LIDVKLTRLRRNFRGPRTFRRPIRSKKPGEHTVHGWRTCTPRDIPSSKTGTFESGQFDRATVLLSQLTLFDQRFRDATYAILNIRRNGYAYLISKRRVHASQLIILRVSGATLLNILVRILITNPGRIRFGSSPKTRSIMNY